MNDQQQVDSLKSYKINQRLLQTIQQAEFLMEFLINMKTPGSESNLNCLSSREKLLGILAVCEMLKLKLRLDKWRSQKCMHIFISESNSIEKQELEEEERAELFEKEWSVENITLEKNGKSIDEMKLELQTQLNKMKKNERFKFNLGYQDILLKSNKKMGVITTLPIPEQFKRQKSNRLTLKKMRKLLGETLFIIRPLVYCILLFIFGTHSYIPYIVSLVIDIFRQLLEKDIEFYRKCEKYEMNQRMKDFFVRNLFNVNVLQICYLLRNPFYINILKSKIILPILKKLFKENSLIARMIIYLIELRCSLSLLM